MAKSKRCTLGRPVRICGEPATYSEADGRLYCDRHGRAKHELRARPRAHRCRHCILRAEARARQEDSQPTTEVD